MHVERQKEATEEAGYYHLEQLPQEVLALFDAMGMGGEEQDGARYSGDGQDNGATYGEAETLMLIPLGDGIATHRLFVCAGAYFREAVVGGVGDGKEHDKDEQPNAKDNVAFDGVYSLGDFHCSNVWQYVFWT